MTDQLHFDPETVDLDALFKRLHLANARRNWRSLCQRAEEGGWSPRKLLGVLVAEEMTHRAGTRVARGVRKADFPFIRTIEDFDFSLQSTVKLPMLGSYLGPELVSEGRNLVLLGKTGRGSHEYCDVMGRVDILTGTFGKALGGASGGYTSGRKEIVEMLRQRSRPYLFSNTLAPGVAAASLKALSMVSASTELVSRLARNTRYFRDGMSRSGFAIAPGDHPIVPVMLGEATLAVTMAERLLEEGVYVIGFSYPVVPRGAARIRIQVSAAFLTEDLDFAVGNFTKVGKELGLIA